MNKNELLKTIDGELMEKLFGFCYARTQDSAEAGDLCSDIIFALVKAANQTGEISSLYPFIWRVARNVYADYSKERKNRTDLIYSGDPEKLFLALSEDTDDDNTEQLLKSVYRQIAFLTKAYREVMIQYYLEGRSVSDIAKQNKIGENTVRQRLFEARRIIKSEVNEMTDNSIKPVSLEKIEYFLAGTGSPAWDDPRNVFSRQFSKHILWLCLKKPMRASEIAEELNVPTLYVEEELEILTRGEKGRYGLLRKNSNGTYSLNIVLFDRDTIEKAHQLYIDQIPNICKIIADHFEANKEQYLAFPYLNRKKDLNLIYWQQIFTISDAFSSNVERILKNTHFADHKQPDRPFTVFGYVYNGEKKYGCGCDGTSAQNICGYKNTHFINIYITRINRHFCCSHNVSRDPKLQLTLRAIKGLPVSSLTEQEKENAAKAIEENYIYREGDMLYTKILVNDMKDDDKLFELSHKLWDGYFEKEAQIVADKLAKLIKSSLPDYLYGEWKYANMMANFPVLDNVVEHLIEKGVLTPPETHLGAEGCWVSVE